jgi:hypothetical protein
MDEKEERLDAERHEERDPRVLEKATKEQPWQIHAITISERSTVPAPATKAITRPQMGDLTTACCPNGCLCQWRDRKGQQVRLTLKRVGATDLALKACQASYIAAREFGSKVSGAFRIAPISFRRF